MNMKVLTAVDLVAFCITIAAGILAALAGGLGLTRTAVAAGCIAVVAPIVNRIATTSQQKALLRQLGPRSLSSGQRRQLVELLRVGPSFELWVAHNRHEAEPTQFQKQISDALSEAGLKTKYFGGMNNSTVGVEISGDTSPEKTRLMNAFAGARIPFLEIRFTDRQGQHWGLGVWIGSNPGASSG